MTCTSCNTTNAAEAAFCGQCGKPLSAAKQKKDDSFLPGDIFLLLVIVLALVSRIYFLIMEHVLGYEYYEAMKVFTGIISVAVSLSPVLIALAVSNKTNRLIWAVVALVSPVMVIYSLLA